MVNASRDVPAADRADAMTDHDARFLRCAFAEAKAGDAPFGAVIVRDAAVVARGCNETRRAGDPTAHAEIVAIRHAGSLAEGATLYASTEPCAMCAAAAQVAGIARIVFGLRERDLARARGRPLDWRPLPLPVTEVAARSPTPLRVDGPWLEAEAAALHAVRGSP